MLPLWLLEKFFDFGQRDCEFCKDVYGKFGDARAPGISSSGGGGRSRKSRRGRVRLQLRTSWRRFFAYRQMEEERAAALIQRNYRGYRERRQLSGLGLSAKTRWREALKELEYRNYTRPVSRRERSSGDGSRARQNWRRVVAVTRRAADDDTSGDSPEPEDIPPAELEVYMKNKHAAKLERDKTARMMGLQYFLEMVDVKHRYGSNLRTYHEQWLRADTDENFFYWLDHGEGRRLDLPIVPRSRLDSERVRYLSREERLNYLVKVDKEGRLCWARNGERISTNAHYKDTLDGIVPIDDEHEAWKADQTRRRPSSCRSESSISSDHSHEEESSHHTNQETKQVKSWQKLKHVSAATIFDQLLQMTVKPNSWIFVADTSFRLYIGIKQSGTFQHSSFLHGARISAAGLIVIKDGQLRQLSPLSGHYRPPTKNFRLFVHSLRDEGADMSRVSISRAYAVLVGLEAYTRTRKKIEHGFQHKVDKEDKLLDHRDVKKKQVDGIENIDSAEKQKMVVETTGPKLGLLGRLVKSVQLSSGKAKDGEAGVKQGPSTLLRKPAPRQHEKPLR